MLIPTGQTTVTVTLVDPDLNTDSDAVDIYPVDATSWQTRQQPC